MLCRSKFWGGYCSFCFMFSFTLYVSFDLYFSLNCDISKRLFGCGLFTYCKQRRWDPADRPGNRHVNAFAAFHHDY